MVVEAESLIQVGSGSDTNDEKEAVGEGEGAHAPPLRFDICEERRAKKTVCVSRHMKAESDRRRTYAANLGAPLGEEERDGEH